MLKLQRHKTEGEITGRNGTYAIQEIEIGDYSDLGVKIDGIGKRGTRIRGGLWITPETMDQVAAEWIKYRKEKA